MSRILATVKVTDKGRIPLPKEVRDQLHADVGDFVKIYANDNGEVYIAKVEA